MSHPQAKYFVCSCCAKTIDDPKNVKETAGSEYNSRAAKAKRRIKDYTNRAVSIGAEVGGIVGGCLVTENDGFWTAIQKVSSCAAIGSMLTYLVCKPWLEQKFNDSMEVNRVDVLCNDCSSRGWTMRWDGSVALSTSRF